MFLLSSQVLLYGYMQQGVEQARQEAKSIQMTGFAGKAPISSLGNLGSCPYLATENYMHE